MIVQLDTNILTRLASPFHLHQIPASSARKSLEAAGETLCIAPQNLFEFWTVATRPLENNGLGLSIIEALAEVQKIKQAFVLERDLPTLVEEWEKIVLTYECKGKSSHDARLVASMNLRGVTRLLTFNGADFARYENITILDPREFAAT